MLRKPAVPTMPMLIDDEGPLDGPLGRDAGLDSVHNRAAVAIFGVAGLAIIGVAVSWLAFRGAEPSWTDHPELIVPGGSLVPADAPVLRPGFSAGDAGNSAEGAFTLPARITAAPQFIQDQPLSR